MSCNEATNRKDKRSLSGQSPTPRCHECEGQGRVLSTRNLLGWHSGYLSWQTCEGCGGSGLSQVDRRGAVAPRERSYSEE